MNPILFLITVLSVFAQLQVTSTLYSYKQQVKANPDKKLVELVKVIPNLKLDIRYATKNNFTGVEVYPSAKAYARKPVALALKKVQKDLKKLGLGLKIYDAYRPYAITVKFWQVTPTDKKAFVANPAKGSRHNRGCAVDLTLINLKTGKEIAMPTPYDSFKPEADPNYMALSPEVLKNRKLLIKLMENNGFKVIGNEWWHFDFTGWENYELMDIAFKDL